MKMIYQKLISFKWFLLFLSVLIQFHLIEFVRCQSCGPRVSPRLMKDIPCDLNSMSYCTQPGSAYPWSSVRRYIFENQGFVKKMYGEQRQSQIIREELQRINEQYQDIHESSTLRNARQRNFQYFDSHNENDSDGMKSNKDIPNQNNNINHTKNTEQLVKIEIDNITISINNLDRLDMETFVTTSQENSIVDTNKFVETSTEYSPITELTSDNDFITDDSFPDESDKDNKEVIKGYNACPITQEVVAPYWANNTRGETLALLNVYPFEQYIHWEKCAFEGEQMFCRDGCRCEQQFRLHRLLAFDPKNECRGIFADWFRFPGCCVCICYDNHERINDRKARL